MAIDLNKYAALATRKTAGTSEPKIAMSIFSVKDKSVYDAWQAFRAKAPMLSDVARIQALLDHAGLMPAPVAAPVADVATAKGKAGK